MARRTRPSRNQPQFFPAGEDLPLFTETPYGPPDAASVVFEPAPIPLIYALFDLRPKMGPEEPTYNPLMEI